MTNLSTPAEIIEREFRKLLNLSPRFDQIAVEFGDDETIKVTITEPACDPSVWVMEIESDDDGFSFREIEQGHTLNFEFPYDWFAACEADE